MPVMNGIKATEKIREWEHMQDRTETPIVIVTGNYSKLEKNKIQKYRFDDFFFL